MQKKIAVVWGYFAKNLGDDLMLKAFLNATKGKYKKVYINSYKEYQDYYSELGVVVVSVNSFFYRVINKILAVLHKPQLYYHYPRMLKADFVMLGGSLFAESDNNDINQNQFKNLSYAVNKSSDAYVIGSNFGPYKNNEFLHNYDSLFGRCKDVCFRDKQSYNIFSNNDNVRYAPDIILSGIWDEIKHRQKSNSVIISVIDLDRRKDLQFAKKEYETMMADIAKAHLRWGEQVLLAAYCEFEGDVEACVRIKSLCGEDNVEIIIYNDWNFLNLFSSAKKIYGTRFHSVILSMYYNIPCVPFIYTQKTYDALVSYGASFDCVNIRNLSDYSITEITENYGISNVDLYLKSLAEKQFDEVIDVD